MAESDESGKSRTATPELNPLLNPLLNKNLGRWAEVYFKCPADRRDEAVVQLLQELEREDSQSRAGGSFGSEQSPGDTASGAESSRFAVENLPVDCPSCGFAARPNQKYCGRCGAKLISPAPTVTHIAEAEREPDPQLVSHKPDMEPPANWRPIEPAAATEPAGIEPDFLSVQESRPFWYSYRFYIGTVLAVVLGLLGYMAWRGSQNSSSGIKLPEQAPAAASAPSPAATIPQEPTQSEATPQPSAPGPAKPAEETQKTAERAPTPTAAPADQPKETPVTPMEGVSKPPVAEPASVNGSQELATAKEYLDGNGGKSPDNAQAVEWLWKSVSKRNTEATVLLGRLYLRGEGVAKNCDQGRILLDAAARKGSKDAAFTLQHLQAFSCP